MNEPDQAKSSNTSWSQPALILGALFISLSLIALIGLTRPFWFQLLLAACLVTIALRLIRYTQSRFHFLSRLPTSVGIVFFLLLDLFSIPLAEFLTTSIDQLVTSITEFVITLAEDLISFLSKSTNDILGVEGSMRSPIVGPLIEYLQAFTAEAPAAKNLVK